MKLNPYPGLFIALEGLDGSGSDAIALGLVKALIKEKLPVVFVKEPSQSRTGRFIREILKERQGLVSPLTVEFLFAADRALQLEERVIPALKDKNIVIADRCLWSSIAYRSLFYPIHWLLEINMEFFLPDLTFFIDVNPTVCAKNISKDKNEISLFEKEDLLSRVRDGYQEIWNKFGYCFTFMDGKKSPEEITKTILQIAKSTMKIRKVDRKRK